MKVNTETFAELTTPMYVVEEQKLRRNLQLIARVAEAAGVEIILAFKAFALWKTFSIFKEYIRSTTASSLFEARLAYEKFGTKAHTYSPAYTPYEIEDIARCSSHLTFNSLTQLSRYGDLVKGHGVSVGLRINPEYSEVATLLYNPCAPGTRFGVTADVLDKHFPEEIDGFHCHTLCESSPEEFARTLHAIETKFSKWFPRLKWINFGGGHLMTRSDYDTDKLIALLTAFKSRYPHLQVILEPGSAFAWQTGSLVAQVVDVVNNQNIQTAVLNVSFTCHMPDCLEMPYTPVVRGAEIISETDRGSKEHVYRLGGNSCLSGDYMGYWRFNHALEPGENIIFEDMIHYTTVKTNMFNGVAHPAIGLVRQNNSELEVLRTYTFEDYCARMD